MLNKIGKVLRKAHRYLTPLFLIITIWLMIINQNPQIGVVLNKVQKVLMLTLAATGTFLYVQIYYNKNKSKKRKQSK